MRLTYAKQERGEDGIAVLTLDYPELKINKLSDGVWEELDALAGAWTADPSLRGVVIASAKRSVFLAGADITELQDLRDPARPDFMSARAHRVLGRIENCGKPVVAAVAGAALGGGMELLLAAHAVVAADDDKVKLGLPETKLGLIPGAGGTQRLPRKVGLCRAAAMVVSGDPLGAAAAREAGLVQSVVPAERLVDEARRTALRLAAEDFAPAWGALAGHEAGLALVEELWALDRADPRFAAWIAALTVMHAGAALPFEEGLRLEREAFARVAVREEAHALIREFLAGVRR